MRPRSKVFVVALSAVLLVAGARPALTAAIEVANNQEDKLYNVVKFLYEILDGPQWNGDAKPTDTYNTNCILARGLLGPKDKSIPPSCRKGDMGVLTGSSGGTPGSSSSSSGPPGSSSSSSSSSGPPGSSSSSSGPPGSSSSSSGPPGSSSSSSSSSGPPGSSSSSSSSSGPPGSSSSSSSSSGPPGSSSSSSSSSGPPGGGPEGPSETPEDEGAGVATATGPGDNAAKMDEYYTGVQARAVAIPRTMNPPDFVQAAKNYKIRCGKGFMAATGREGKINEILGCADQAHPRWDRSLESLLGPWQYRAPPGMSSPADLTGDPGGYEDIYAAAGFCLNLAQNSSSLLPDVEEPSPAAFSAITETAFQESYDSKSQGACWRFLEERIAYPPGSPALGGLRRSWQVARCQADALKHVITLSELFDCYGHGRSTLQARADMAYRAYSPAYIDYLVEEVGILAGQILFGLALNGPTDFASNLSDEHAAMTSAMSSSHGALGSTNPVRTKIVK